MRMAEKRNALIRNRGRCWHVYVGGRCVGFARHYAAAKQRAADVINSQPTAPRSVK